MRATTTFSLAFGTTLYMMCDNHFQVCQIATVILETNAVGSKPILKLLL